MNPTDAYRAYNNAQLSVSLDYNKYWRDKFAAVGIQFKPDTWGGATAIYKGYELDLYSNPACYEGAKIRVFKTGSVYYHSTKIKSDTGFAKLMLKLDRGLI